MNKYFKEHLRQTASTKQLNSFYRQLNRVGSSVLPYLFLPYLSCQLLQDKESYSKFCEMLYYMLICQSFFLCWFYIFFVPKISHSSRACVSIWPSTNTSLVKGHTQLKTCMDSRGQQTKRKEILFEAAKNPVKKCGTFFRT